MTTVNVLHWCVLNQLLVIANLTLSHKSYSIQVNTSNKCWILMWSHLHRQTANCMSDTKDHAMPCHSVHSSKKDQKNSGEITIFLLCGLAISLFVCHFHAFFFAISNDLFHDVNNSTAYYSVMSSGQTLTKPICHIIKTLKFSYSSSALWLENLVVSEINKIDWIWNTACGDRLMAFDIYTSSLKFSSRRLCKSRLISLLHHFFIKIN